MSTFDRTTNGTDAGFCLSTFRSAHSEARVVRPLLRRSIAIGPVGLCVRKIAGIGTLDTNGSPKLLRGNALRSMRLTSRRWFLDPELMIKAHYMGLKVMEVNVFARMRGTGLSHVRPSTCWEFFAELLRYRFTGAPPPAPFG